MIQATPTIVVSRVLLAAAFSPNSWKE